MYDSDPNGLLGCNAGLARTSAQRKQDSSYWLRATTLDREVSISIVDNTLDPKLLT